MISVHSDVGGRSKDYACERDRGTSRDFTLIFTQSDRGWKTLSLSNFFSLYCETERLCAVDQRCYYIFCSGIGLPLSSTH